MAQILFIITEDWYFVSHRLYLAEEAVRLGFKVSLLTQFTTHREVIESKGIRTIAWSINRSSKNLYFEYKAISEIKETITRLRPNIIHSVAIKPVIYSAIASNFTGLKARVFALGGLGFIFTSKRNSAKLLRPLIKITFYFILRGKHTRLILQNPEDQLALLSANIIKKRNICLIKGAGVDTKKFYYQKIPNGLPLIILSARMLWAKGIRDFIECAKEINKKEQRARFALVGIPDVQNPDAVPSSTLEKWNSEGIIEWWGYKSDMAKVIHKSSIVCLPTSYGEGLPKSLLEAASCGRPIIAYDVPGCREIVKDGYNGFLVAPKNINDLIKVISHLLQDTLLCNKMGKNGRKIVEKHYTQEKIAKETFSIWNKLLD